MHVGGDERRAEARSEHRHRGLGVGAEVVLDARLALPASDPHFADLPAHDRQAGDAFGQLRVEGERARHVGQRSDREQLEALDLARRAHDPPGAGSAVMLAAGPSTTHRSS